MRRNLEFVILFLLTLILVMFLAHRFQMEDFGLFSPAPDSVSPRPLVKLRHELYGEASSIECNDTLKKSISRGLRLIITLSNNSSEPSIRGAFAAGVLVVLRGARIIGYELGGFSGIIGVSENGSVIDPANSSIVEFFADRIDPWQSISAELYIVVEGGLNCISVAYRGWIIDEDDIVIEPVSGSREHYIARFPAEEYPDNPPDSRWAGKDFMKYKLREASICLNK